MAINVYMVRHGETYFNMFARLQGWSDTPLTDKGEADAAKVGQELAPLKIDYLFSSDLKRAVDTARILIKNHPSTTITEPTQSKLFREVFYGSFEGHSNEEGAIWASHLAGDRMRRLSEVINKYGMPKLHDLLHEADPAHLAEDSQQLDARCDQAMNFLRQLPDGSNVVVASHGSIIRYIACRYGDRDDYEGPDNGAIMKLALTPESAKVVFYNEKSLKVKINLDESVIFQNASNDPFPRE